MVCNDCVSSELPFYGLRNLNFVDSLDDDIKLNSDEIQVDEHLYALNARRGQLSFLHLNTQSLTSSFDEFRLTIEIYKFDVITLSETWLKNNSLLLNHVKIPGFMNEFRNRDIIRGGGVGAYISESINYKRRKDIKNRYPNLEHLWLEVRGKNKHRNLLLGTIYRSNRILDTKEWFMQMIC